MLTYSLRNKVKNVLVRACLSGCHTWSLWLSLACPNTAPHKSKFRLCGLSNWQLGECYIQPLQITSLQKTKHVLNPCFSQPDIHHLWDITSCFLTSEFGLCFYHGLWHKRLKHQVCVLVNRLTEYLPVLCSSGPWCSACSSSSTWQAVPLGTPGIFLFSCRHQKTVQEQTKI